MDEFQPIDLFGDGGSAVKDDFSDISSEKEEPVSGETPAAKEEELPAIDEPSAGSGCSGEEPPEAEAEEKRETDPAISEKLDRLIESDESLREQLAQLAELFNKRIMYTDHEEKVIDNMHRELQKYKEDMYAQLIRPVMLDIIEVRESILRVSASLRAKPEGEQDVPNKTFSEYALELQDILEKNNVEVYRSTCGEAFVPIKQRVVKKALTGDKELHGKVAESLSCGYAYNGRTISAEKVAVYYYDESFNNNNKSEVENNG